MVEDLIRRDGFSFRLRLGMVIADIRTSEMATEIGVCDSAISNIKSGTYNGSEETRLAMLKTLERRRPGTLAAIRTAEKVLETSPKEQPLIRRHDFSRSEHGRNY